LLKEIKTPTLVLAAERLQGEVLGEFRKTAELLPHGRLVVFPGVTGFVQHLLPVPCARVWLDFATSLRAHHV
jgi:pimeloyl-ACP methyl ester carboxylesterase